MAAVIHHGGAGTTAATSLAGKPSLVCSFMGDQSFWGNRVCKLGAGPALIPQRELRVDNLSESFHQLTQDRKMYATAEQIGKNLRQENGVKQAVSILE